MKGTKREMKRTNLIAGVDEAGRGAVIGPLVMAGVSIDKSKEKFFKKLYVRDSKLISPKRRQYLAKKIEKIAKDIIIVKVSACRIDTYRKQGVNLNKIEAIKFADIINYLKPKKVFVDAPDTNPEKLRLFLKKMMKHENDGIDLVVEHKADHKYSVCSAASIIAKVARDGDIEKLKKKYGDFGPGYSSNEKTIAWLKSWLEKHGKFPDIVRKTWATAIVADGNHKQSKISTFFKRLKGREDCEK